MRKTPAELEEIKQKFHLKELWSYSRISSWKTSKYEWFLRYVKHEKPDSPKVSAYSFLGGAAHDILEAYYNDEISYEEMLPKFEDEWDTFINVLGYKFNKEDNEKDKNAAKRYHENIIEFFKNYKKLPWNIITERFLLCKITDEIYVQGYVDAICKDNNEMIHILDWKTSSLYRGQAMKDHSHQLVLYAEAIRQKGIPRENIKIAFCFLKYVKVAYQQVNGKIKESFIERNRIGEKLRTKAKTWLKKQEDLSEEQIVEMLDEMCMTNRLKHLPKEVQEKFIIDDAYCYIDNWWEIYDELKPEIIEMVTEIEDAIESYEALGNDKVFWDTDEKIKKELFYHYNLNEYSINKMKDVKNYLDRQEAEKKAADDLLGIGNKVKKEEDNFDWLNEL